MARGVVFGGLNSGGSNIKSVQRGIVSMSGLTTKDVTISNVDTEKAIVIISHVQDTANSGSSYADFTAEIINQTTLRLNRNSSQRESYPYNVSYEIIEFNNVKSLQKGEKLFTNRGVEETVAISPINIEKSFIVSTSTHEGGNSADWNTAGRIINETTLGFITNNIRSNTTKWAVIEFR